MDFKTLHEDWKTLSPGPFTEPEDEAIYKEFMKIKEQGDVHHHHYAKGDNPDDKKKREKDAKAKAKEGEAKADKPDSNGEAKPKEGEAKANGNGEEKPKLDPVGKEDGDIDNDGDQDKADKYLAKKRKAIGKSIKSQKKTKNEKPIKLSGEKEKVKLHKGVEEASTYRDSKKAEDNKKVKKFAFGKKKERRIAGVYHSGYSKEETELGEGHEKEIANFMDKSFQGVDYHFKQGALHVAKGFRGKVARRMAGEGIKPPIKGIKEEENLDELSPELMRRAWQGATKKAAMAGRQKVADRGDKEAAADHAKRRKQSSKFFGKYIKTQEEAELDEAEYVKPVFSGKEKANIKRTLGFSFADKVKKYNKKLQKTKDSIKKYKSEDTEVDEMSAVQKTALNIHNQRVKLGIVKPGTKKINKKESGVQKAAKSAGMSSAERSYLYNDNHLEDIELEERALSGKEVAQRMLNYKGRGGHNYLKGFAKDVAKMRTVTRNDLEKLFPDYVDGSDITKLLEGWKKGKHKITNDKGEIVSIHSSGAKAEREQQKLMQTGDHKKLTVAHVGHKSIWKNEEAELDEAPSDYEDEIKKFKAGGGKVKKLKPGRKFASLFKQKGAKKLPRQAEETEDVEEGTGLAVKMALDDAGLKGKFKDGKVSVHKKHVKKAHKALKGNVYYKGKTPDVVGEDILDEATKSQLRDFSQELAAYARKHRSSIDKQYYEKIAQIAASGKMPSAKDIDTDTEPRDVVLGMMAKSFPSGVMKSFKGVSPALDRSLSKSGGLYYARHGEEVEHEGDMTEDLKAIEKEIDKLHSRTKHMKYLTGKDRDAMRVLSRKRDAALKGRKFEEVELDELVAPGKKSASGYILYHKTFSDAMQHAVDHAKTKGVTVDPKEIDDKVATGPRKPSSGKTNRYSLGAGRKTVQIQVANLDNKAYELNMYIEGVQFDEDFKGRISNNPLINKLYLMNQAKAIAKEKAGPDKEHKISAWEDLAKKMGFSRRKYEEFGDNQGMYESSIPQEKGDMATKTRLKLEKVLENRKKIVEPKESERAGEWGTDKLSDNYKEATPGQDVKEGNIIVNDRDPYRVFEHMVHYLMGTSIKNVEDYSFYKIEETPDKLRLENKEGALATITLADVQSFYDDQDMGMDEFVEMIVGFGVKELTEKENSIIGDEGTPAIGKDKMGQGIYTTDPPKTFESHVDVYSKYIQSNEQRLKKGFVVN